MYQTPFWDVADLKQHLIDTWNDLPQSIVDNAVDEWCKRLQACVNENFSNRLLFQGSAATVRR